MLGKVLVTGGAGCLGSHIIEVLHEKKSELGVREIVVLDLMDSIRWASPEEDKRIRGYCSAWHVGSIIDAAFVTRVVAGCDAVIHVASLVETGVANPKMLFEVNVRGTENVIAACQAANTVKALVYASSLDVVVNMYDFEDKDGPTEETALYALDDPRLDYDLASRDTYCVTKTLAEKKILRANTTNVLRTSVVRPVGLYGERDSVHIGTLLGAACSAGALNLFRFGDGSSVFQHVYAKNCAWMHVLAAKRLVEGNNQVGGQAFYGIDNTKVNNFFDFFFPYFLAKGYKVPTIHLPESICYPLAAFVEDVYLLVRHFFPKLAAKIPLKFTRRAIQGTCFTAWFDTDKAKRLLGYEPLVTPMEARRRTIEAFAVMTDKFPPGPYKYPAGQFDYIDDGKDFRPDNPAYLKRGIRRGHHSQHLVLPLLGLGSALGLVLGVRKGFIQVPPEVTTWIMSLKA